MYYTNRVGIWSLLRLVLSLTQRYSSTTTKINLLHFLRGTQKKIFWKMSGSRCTSKTYFVCVCVCVCVFSTRKKVNHIWNNMRVSEWLLYFHFRLYYPSKGALIYFIFIIISPVSLGYLLLDIFLLWNKLIKEDCEYSLSTMASEMEKKNYKKKTKHFDCISKEWAYSKSYRWVYGWLDLFVQGAVWGGFSHTALGGDGCKCLGEVIFITMVTIGQIKYIKRGHIVQSKRLQEINTNRPPIDSQAKLSDEAFAPIHSGLLYIQTAWAWILWGAGIPEIGVWSQWI